MIRIATAVLAAAVVGSVTAIAALAGGTPALVGHGYAGSTRQEGEPADVVVGGNGRTIAHFTSVWSAKCQSAPGQSAPPSFNDRVVITNVPIMTSGLFQKTLTLTKPLGNGPNGPVTGQETVTLKGAFKTQFTAVGTLRGQLVASDAKGTLGNCDSGTISWSANDLLGYVGLTSQRLTVDARFSAGVKKVAAFHIFWDAKCQHGSTFDNNSVSFDDPVSQGTFADKGTVPPVDLGGGSTAGESLSMTGRFVSATLVRGTFRIVRTVKNQQGAVVDTCTTGTITWTARD